MNWNTVDNQCEDDDNKSDPKVEKDCTEEITKYISQVAI